MARARYTGDGGTFRIRRLNFEPGEEKEVDHDLATYLADRDDFVVSVEKEGGPADAGDEDEAETDSDDDQDDDGFDATAFVDRTPYGDVVDDIEAGKVDDHLDAVAGAADRVGVEDAVGERRAELEG